MVAFGSLAHGLLSGNWSKDKSHAYDPLFFKENIDKNLELVEALREIANEKQTTIPQLAIAWLLSKGNDIIILVGASRRSTLKDSLKAIEINLSADYIQRIENVISSDKIAGCSFPNMQFKNGIVVR